jgi:TonB-dependent starch-binding outer membrane protein SusC
MKIFIKLFASLLVFLIANTTNTYAQNVISGSVKSAAGLPLGGVSVQQKNSKLATTTNPDGYFSIKTTSGSVLSFSYVGYEIKEEGATKNMEVILSPKANILSDVEIVVDRGYGKSRKLAVSSSIASISAKEIQNQPAYNLGTLLQGKATGVQVTNTSNGFPKILIRGFTTLNTSTDPLIILDGINLGRANLNLINVSDIETIDILKDGAAAAIYGTDASGGVIVLTTKKGKAGKMQTDLNVTYGTEFYKNPGLADGNEYLEVQKRRFTNYTTPTWATNTDWWSTVIKPTNVVNANLSLSGGSEKLTGYGSASFYRTEGPYYNGFTQRATFRVNVDFKPNKYVKAGVNLYPRLENFAGGGLGDLMPAMRTEPILPIYVTRPGHNEYSQFSSSFIERNSNPVAVLSRAKNGSNYFFGMIGDVHLDITPIKNLTIRTQIGGNYGNTNSKSYSTPYFNSAFGARDQNYDSIAGNPDQTKDNFLYASRAFSSSSYNFDWRFTNTADYYYSLGSKHKFNLLIGTESRKESGGGTSSGRAYIPTDQPGLWNPNNAGTPILAASPNNFISAGGSRYNETWLSYFGRLNYEFNNKYFIELTARRDGSSRFPVSNKYGTFPSVSGSWIVTREKFMQRIKPLSFLKVRAGFGNVGNASFSDPSVGLDLLSSRIVSYGGATNYNVIGGTVSNILALARPGNPDLIWETTQDRNFAIESYWLKNKLYINFENYNRKSKNLLFLDNVGRPDLGIRSGSWYNLGTMEVKGIEAVIGYKDKFKSGFGYDVSVNMSRNRVYLNELGTNEAAILSTAQGGYRVSEDLGGPTAKLEKNGGLLGNFYGLQVLSVFQNQFEINAYTDKNGNKIQPNAVPGDFKFEDLDKNGVINEDDKKVLGNAYPKFELGVNIKVEYKGIDIAMNGYGRFGHKVFWVAKKWFEGGALGSNVFKGALAKAWNGEGSTNSYPRLINDAQDNNRNLKSSNSWFVEDGDYFRLNNIQVGYSLSNRLATKIHLNRLRLFVNMQNIVTFTKYKGLNPEIFNSDFGVLSPGYDLSQAPIRKAVTFGLSVGL